MSHNHSGVQNVKLNIQGMHCASCEVRVERAFKTVSCVQQARVSQPNGSAELLCSAEPDIRELNRLVEEYGYRVSLLNDDSLSVAQEHKNTWNDYFQMGGILLVIVAVYYILRGFDIVPTIAISERMGYGVVFLVGLFAAASTCIAVVGGLLLAVANRFNQAHPELSGIQKFRPHLFFNAGRVVGYTGFGAAVGGLGSVFTLSPRASGLLTVAVSFVMLLLGFQLLHVFPRLRRFGPRMPKFISHRIHDLSEKQTKGAPFVLGASTFFLPCGFTQALQLYVLATGDWKTGALTMLVFSLGTLPALISLSAITSFAKGAFQRHVLKFAGVLVVLLALFNINNGFALAGVRFDLASAFRPNRAATSATGAPTSPLVNGKQVVDMKVSGYTYAPSAFTVRQGVPVEWRIDGAEAAGCGQVLVMPTLGITKYLAREGITTVAFTPTETGTIPFNCSMGMMTRGAAFTVVPNDGGAVNAKTKKGNAPEPTGCNPDIMNCVPIQKVSLGVSRERGVYPDTLTVKKGVPVELAVNTSAPLGGCMSVWVIPEYDVTIPMKVGVNTATFTPTKTGTFPITCSMGSRMALLTVTD